MKNKAKPALIAVTLSLMSMTLHSLPARAAEGGSNHGGTGRGDKFSAVVTQWCQKEDLILNQYLDQSRMDDLDQATFRTVETLLQGLKQALADAQDVESSRDALTYRVLERGVELGTLLQDMARNDQTGQTLEAARAFLLHYYEFALETESKLDVPLYIPNRAGKLAAGSVAELESRFVEFAKQGLELYFKVFVQPGPAGEVLPLYSDKAALRTLEFLTKYAADDLVHSVWAERNACSIGRLQLLNHNLAEHNGGNTAIYRKNDRYAINLSAAAARKAIAGLGGSCSK